MRLIPYGLKFSSIPLLVLFFGFNLLTSNHLLSQSKVDSLKQMIRQGDPDQGKLSLKYASLAREYCLKNNDSCLIAGFTGLKLAEKAGSREGIIKNCVQLALFHLWADSLNVSKRYFLRANDLFTSETDPLDRMRALNGLGYITELQSDFAGAIGYYLQGKRVAEESGHDEWKADFINNIAVVYNSAGIYRKCISLYQESIKIYQEQNDSVLYANTLVNIGAAYLGLKMVDSAMIYYNLSLPIQRRLHNYYGLANLNLGLATIKMDALEFDEALDLLKSIRTMIDSLDESFHGSALFIKVEMELKTAVIYLKIKNFREAEPLFRLVRAHAMEGSFLRYETEALRGLSELFVLKGFIDSALWYSNLHHKYSDSLLTIRNEQKIALMLQEFNHIIEKERKEADEVKRASGRSRNLLVFVLAISVVFAIAVVLLLLYLLQRSKSHRLSLMEANLRLEKSNLELEKAGLEKDNYLKSKEVMAQSMSLVEKNELMAEMSDRLKGLIKSNPGEDNITLSSLVHDIQTKQSDGFWEEFNTHFREIHADFYKRFSSDFPGLTPNEVKLCAFIKLNLSTKEIARITRKTEHSIKIARYRLRRKLNLEREANLTMFLGKY